MIFVRRCKWIFYLGFGATVLSCSPSGRGTDGDSGPDGGTSADGDTSQTLPSGDSSAKDSESASIPSVPSSNPTDSGDHTGGEGVTRTPRGTDTNTDTREVYAPQGSDIYEQDAGVDDAGNCVSGTIGCACDENGYCDEGLQCIGDLCRPPGVCTPGVVNGIADVCADQLRTCEEGEDGARCGDCIEGAREENGECVRPLLCGEVECDETTYCDMSNSAAPICVNRPCAVNQAQDTLGNCITCARSCDVEGSTGRYWAFTDNEDNCLCETRPDYFLPKGGDVNPEKCDADRDGWVRDDIQDPVFQTAQGIRDNMRCTVREIDRVILQDEYGISMEILSCDTGLIKNTDPLQTCDQIVPLLLVESKRNDTPGDPELDRDGSPSYGGREGRPLRANELNALTKGCVSLLADYNDNQKEDIDEAQIMIEDPVAFSPKARLFSFSYFIELYKSQYETQPGNRYGALRITERSRCDASIFPLGYDENQQYNPGIETTYWRNCYRRRDPGYQLSTSTEASVPGYDFGQWTCTADSGSCTAAAPAHYEINAVDYDFNRPLLRQHGLCELGALPPVDQVWRGMHHHSQFKCLQVLENNAAEGTRDRNVSDFLGSNSKLTFNSCEAKECDLANDEPTCSDSELVIFEQIKDQTREPVITCTQDQSRAIAGAVGFAAVGYQPYSDDPEDYYGGCVTEDTEWDYLCPVLEYGEPVTSQSNFGRFHCWCILPSFLWATDEMSSDNYNRSTLIWADDSGNTPNNSLWAPDNPMPDTVSPGCPD